MIKKIAIFVEGNTELHFVKRLIQELAGKRNIYFEIMEQKSGSLSIVNAKLHANPFIHILIANCRSDGQVKTQIRDRFDHLKSSDYSLIIGLRDIYPLQHEDIKDLEEYLQDGLPYDAGLPIHLHLAVLEIEAWFLEETSHFARIDAKLTESKLIENGFDFRNQRAFELHHPAATLHKIYTSVGKFYNKKEKNVQRTVEAISYEELYENTREKAPSLDEFIASLELGIFSK